MKFKLNLPPKLKLFIPIFIGIIIAILTITILTINTTTNTLNEFIAENLKLEVKTLKKMFEREYALKLEKVKTDLKVADKEFHSRKLKMLPEQIEFEASNQITKNKHKVNVNLWKLNGHIVQNHYDFVDEMQSLFGGTVTIFQKIDSGYLRVSTNVLKTNGERAIGTYIPNDSPVIKTIENNEVYIGRAYVVNDWYITAYEPIKHKGEILGMLYVGGKEKDLQTLRKTIMELSIGKSGFPYVMDDEGTFIIHPVSEGENWSDMDFMKKILATKNGTLSYYSPTTKSNRFTAFEYFNGFHFYVAATIDPVIETSELKNTIIYNAVIVSIIILILLSVFVYFITSDNIHSFLKEIEASNRRLNKVQDALRRTEKLAELGQLSSGIVREITEPVVKISGKSKSLKESFDKDSTVYSSLDEIQKNAEKTKEILSGILTFSEGNKITLKETNINEITDMVIHDISLPANIELTCIKDKNNIQAWLDTGKVYLMLKNLIMFCINSIPDTGKIIVKVTSDNKNIEIQIHDNSPGLSKEDTKQIFEPFYVLQQSLAPRHGLGLSVAYGIARMHKGDIRISSNSNPEKGETGNEFTIELPLSPY